MKCPQCASDLNTRHTLSLPRFEGAGLILCAFCETVVAVDPAGRAARVMGACGSCGAPLEASSGERGTTCGSCRDALVAPAPDREAMAEASERIQKEVLRAYPALPPGEAEEYLNHVLADLAAKAGYDRSAFRLVVTPDLEFRTASLVGGVILAGREILIGLEDEAMLAFVLARELAHQQSGRVARRFRAWRAPGPLATSLEWGLGWLTKATLPGRSAADLVKEVAWLGYGSVHEQHADEWAIKLLALAGYDAASAVSYLIKIEKRHLEARGALAAFLDAHPARSRRRCLAETLVEIESARTESPRTNRETYLRMAAALGRDDLVPYEAGRAVRSDPRI